MSLEEANEVLDKETAEEEAALRLSGVRTRAMERDARAAWARWVLFLYVLILD